MKTRTRVLIIAAVAAALGAIGVFWYLRHRDQNRDHFSVASNVVIMTASQTAEFLAADEDGYVHRQLSPYDLIARDVPTAAAYIQRIRASAHDPTSKERQILRTAIDTVDAYLAQSQHVPAGLKSAPWVIAVTSGRAYENGYPHTRRHVIFVTDDIIRSNTLASTLLHEKVHIYQRMNPQDVDTWIRQRGFRKVGPRSNERLARANPDLDEFIYVDPNTNKHMVALYNSERPKGISDVKLTNPAFEHPFEHMAYEIADAFVTSQN